ncbi:MAG: hypothetical protein ACRDRP_15355, partial [Pseudonocardiaceae bacterium]
MRRASVEELVRGLRVWTVDHDRYVRAAVELLIEHDHWLRNGEFVDRCVRRATDAREGGFYWVDWEQARAAFDAVSVQLVEQPLARRVTHPV